VVLYVLIPNFNITVNSNLIPPFLCAEAWGMLEGAMSPKVRERVHIGGGSLVEM
jgi:hypothetical protein